MQFGQPIGEFQLIQEKLARMEVPASTSRTSCSARSRWRAAGARDDLAEASAMKLYSARAATEVALEAVQLFGGNGYMAEFQVEQLARDAKVLQIYAGTDEIQISQIARSLLALSAVDRSGARIAPMGATTCSSAGIRSGGSDGPVYSAVLRANVVPEAAGCGAPRVPRTRK